MARIQIADLQPQNVMELTGEEQLLIQGGWFWLALPSLASLAISGLRIVQLALRGRR